LEPGTGRRDSRPKTSGRSRRCLSQFQPIRRDCSPLPFLKPTAERIHCKQAQRVLYGVDYNPKARIRKAAICARALGVELPILFFIHGSGNMRGASNFVTFGANILDGQRLAESGRVAVVFARTTLT
jgi:hypothetical protein